MGWQCRRQVKQRRNGEQGYEHPTTQPIRKGGSKNVKEIKAEIHGERNDKQRHAQR